MISRAAFAVFMFGYQSWRVRSRSGAKRVRVQRDAKNRIGSFPFEV